MAADRDTGGRFAQNNEIRTRRPGLSVKFPPRWQVLEDAQPGRGFDLAEPCRCGGRRGVWNRYGPACRRCGAEVPAPPVARLSIFGGLVSNG